MITIFVENMSVNGKKVKIKVTLNEEKINLMLYLQFERDELIKNEIFPKFRIIRSIRRYQESLWWETSSALEQLSQGLSQ